MVRFLMPLVLTVFVFVAALSFTACFFATLFLGDFFLVGVVAFDFRGLEGASISTSNMEPRSWLAMRPRLFEGDVAACTSSSVSTSSS